MEHYHHLTNPKVCPNNSNFNALLRRQHVSDSDKSSHWLRSDFYALRHGQSQANVAAIIASDPTVACNRYGLSETGRRQAAAAGQTIVELYRRINSNNSSSDSAPQLPYQGLAIITSDLLRAKETAAIVFEAAVEAQIPLYRNQVVTDVRLRERGFGKWDGTSDANYQKVWREDVLDSSHTAEGVESVDSVIERATECVVEWDSLLPSRHMVVLTAHGDVLQILQTAFLKLPGTQHRSVDHLETATVRALVLE